MNSNEMYTAREIAEMISEKIGAEGGQARNAAGNGRYSFLTVATPAGQVFKIQITEV